MDIKRSGSQPSNPGPADRFTGDASVQMLFAAEEPGRVSGGRVTFQPGASTAWHSHPLGQTLVVPGDPARIAAAIIGSVDVEPAPVRMVLGSQALAITIATLKARIAGFEAQTELAASTDFPAGE